MKATTSILAVIVLGPWSVAQPQERPNERPNDPIELMSMREAWLRDKRDAMVALDSQYKADLEASKARYVKAGDKEAVAAIERELARLQPQTLTGTLLSANEAAAIRLSPSANQPKQKISTQTRRKIESILEGKIWRVDHGGEGQRWYYFAKNGKMARKSRLTNWVWSDLVGAWNIDDFGTVIATGVGNTAQISITANGVPSITLNRDGVLTMRPFHATELEYPGAGKD